MRSNKAERQSHLTAWQTSDLSASAYCREHGLKYPTFMNWVRKEKEEQSVGKFVVLPNLPASSKLTIQFPNGILLHYEGELSKELLDLLHHA